MIIDNLRKMTREQLVEMALKQGLPKPHHATKPENIIKIIMDSIEHPIKPQRVEDGTPNVLKEKKEAVFLTREEIEQLIAPIKAKTPELEAHYDDSARCVTFRCKGAEDCMSMSLPASVMYRKVGLVSRGRLALLVRREFEGGNAGGKNAYTNAVLA